MYGSTDMSCSTGINGQKMPHAASVPISSVFRCSAAALSSRLGKGCPNESMLSVLTEVDDDAVYVESWPNDAKPAAM